ncbi:ABC transporter ATP-binding protein [Candidatus Berkiella aquae]|uniref:ATP-binding cassette domain-containing protein n=2 Tax=Candidatus Berkiella aquae TaxID=295108 RepID=A0AAE3L6H8_9GAMM|nr:ATP-binding cassette domain-containing protein [Candidatus Berkiella aquae]MCS5710238.1 ATP-binding cassette domain-containing protein [Candidatus Berkiella aquae]
MMLQAKNIVKSFTQDTSPILNKLNLSLAPGEFCVLIGSNGSGKSTFLKTLSGENTLDSGQILLNGRDITTLSFSERAKYISGVSQNILQGTIQEMTLLENLVLSQLRGEKAKFKKIKHHYANLREKLFHLNPALEIYLDKPLSCLSGGQKQMVATLMATLNEPFLLLLDEHCSALDPKTQIDVMEFTAKMIAELGITALMVTHHLNDALNYGDRLIMLHQGQISHDFNQRQKKSLKMADLFELFQINNEVFQ